MSKRRPLLLALFLGLVGCDHVTKYEAKHELAGQPPTVLAAGVLDLDYHENHGIAFNLERLVPEPAQLPIYVALTTTVLGALGFAWWRRRREVGLRTAAYATIAAGAVGNLVDRIARGYVVDFIHFHGWPIFNVADVAIAVGIGMLLLDAFRARRTRTAPDQ